MDIRYITNARIPTEKAHGFQICKMCEEFSALGHRVTLVVPHRVNDIKEDVFGYYQLKNNFKIEHIRTLNVFSLLLPDRLRYYLLNLFFSLGLLFKAIPREAIIYTRDPGVAWLFGRRKYRVVYEAHNWPEKRGGLLIKLLGKVNLIVCNSQGTEQAFKQNGFKNTLSAPNGVDLPEFDIKEASRELRQKLNLPLDKKIIMYVGHLYKWKGAQAIVEAAHRFREQKDLVFVLVGGTKSDIGYYKKLIEERGLENILLLGHKEKKSIPEYLKTADLLMLPNTAHSKESERYTSPIKMFEYMASRRLILASDLPSIREVLNENNCIFFKAGNAEDMADKIKVIFGEFSQQKIAALVEQAYSDVKNYTWKNRAKRIEDSINKKSPLERGVVREVFDK